MRRYNFLFILVFLLSFVLESKAGILDEIVNIAAQTIEDSSKSKTDQQLGQPDQQHGLQSPAEAIADIKQGAFGVPLKADLQTVLKWCAENKVDIQNATKEQIEGNARDLLTRVRKIRKEYEIEKFFLSGLEKITADALIDPELDAAEKITILQSQALLETLKNPHVDYERKTYLLEKDFSDGIDLTVEGISTTCQDKRITDSIFSLTVSPSKESSNLLNNSLGAIKINFFRNEMGEFFSYASIALFVNNTGEDVLNKQLQMIQEVLFEKYGAPLFGKIGFPYSQSLFRNDLVFLNKGHTQQLIWKKNIFLSGDIDKMFGREVLYSQWSREGFSLVYFEPEIVEEILALQAQTIEDFKNKLVSENKNKLNAMKNNF